MGAPHLVTPSTLSFDSIDQPWGYDKLIGAVKVDCADLLLHAVKDEFSNKLVAEIIPERARNVPIRILLFM